MKTKFLFPLLLAAGLTNQNIAQAQTFEEITLEGKVISNGKCEIEAQTFICSLVKKSDKEYLVIYSTDGKPKFVIRREDNKVVWVAGISA